MRLAVVVPVLCLVACAAVAAIFTSAPDPAQALIAAARDTDADELLVLRDGVPVVRWTSKRYEAPHQLMSVTKSVVALALGKLVDDGSIGLDDRLDRFFPAWRSDARGAITVEHLLEQTSGLGTTFPNGNLTNVLDEALRQPLLQAPGNNWSYNNDAVNLLSGVVEAVTGESLEQYVRRALFAPLGITTWTWYADDYGHSWVMTGLALGPDDLAKIGQLVLDGGTWRGRRVVSQAWIHRLSRRTAAFQNYGLLWWVGFDFMADLAPSVRAAGRNFVWAQGDANQFLVIDPASKTVLVLQTELLRRPNRDDVGGPVVELLTAYCKFIANRKGARIQRPA